MSERDYAPLSIACVRGLCDKIYEKRKFAGVEIEKMVKDFNDANNTSQLKRLIRVLGQDLMASTNQNVKNGALMGLSSVAVGLGKECVTYLPELTQPIIVCLSDSESRVRYQGAEALFNVLKIARGAALAQFPPVFEALARLAVDPEPQVRQGAELLDRLLKDIVTESAEFSVGMFVPLVRERMYSRGAPARQFVLSWLSVLDAVPGIRLLPSLPDLLDGLLLMLDDPMPEIRRMCDIQLSEFLRSIKKDPTDVDFKAMINILIIHAQSPEELLQLTAITWIKEFVELAGRDMLPSVGGLLLAVLPCLAYADDRRRSIRETATIVNLQLYKLVGSDEGTGAGLGVGGGEGSAGVEGVEGEGEGLSLPAVVGVLVQMLQHNSVQTKSAVLDWILHLYHKMPNEMSKESGVVFESCVRAVTDASDDVVQRALAVGAEICSAVSDGAGGLESSPYYRQFLQELLRLLEADENLLEDRGPFIIRQLCVLLSPEQVYVALAQLVSGRAAGAGAGVGAGAGARMGAGAGAGARFAGALVDVLSTLLLTAAELAQLRARLRAFDDPSTVSLFLSLYGCWCHSPVALLALCLLTHNYQHCNTLIQTFGDLEITVDFLTEVDKLVQLIESPIFAYLRLELLGGPQSWALRGALYGVLMLLPQSEAFHTLRRRLQCVPPPDRALTVASTKAASPRATADIDFDSLLKEFERIQIAHREYKMVDRSRDRAIDKGYS